jgi:hypothetical protein
MDSSFTIKPRGGLTKAYTRDPVTARDAADTEIDPSSAVHAPGDGHPHHDPRHHAHKDQHHDHAPHDVVADPAAREVINRENDVRTLAAAREHPDQALLRQRAYRPVHIESAPPTAPEPHANIKA